MDTSRLAAILSTGASIAGLWIGFFWFYRDYRLDLFREKLFALRDELFDVALKYDVPFTHSSYGLIRSNINGSIRNGHRLGLLEFALFWFLARNNSVISIAAKSRSQRLMTALDEIPDEASSEMRKIGSRLHYLVVEQVIFTSPLLIATLVVALAWAILSRMRGVLPAIAVRLLGRQRLTALANAIDFDASIEASDDKGHPDALVV